MLVAGLEVVWETPLQIFHGMEDATAKAAARSAGRRIVNLEDIVNILFTTLGQKIKKPRH